MKYGMVWLGLFWAGSLFALPISDEGNAEAKLFNTFLSAVYEYREDVPLSYQKLQEALALSPDSKYIRRMLVVAASAMEKPELADAYVDYIQMGENESEDWAVYAVYQAQKRNFQAALEAYKQALVQDPDNGEIFYRYLVLLSVIEPDKVIPELEEFAKTHPFSSPDVYVQIGRLYQQRKAWKPALSYLEKAIHADPTNILARLSKAEIYEATSQYFMMLHELEELEKMGYTDAGAFSRMGAVFLLVKDIPKAESYFLKATQVDQADSASNYFLALLAEERGDFAQAAQYARKAADYPKNAARWLQVSFWERKAGKRQQSLRTLAQAYKQFEGNVEIGFFYGLALNDDQQYNKAARVFEKLLQTNPDYIDARLHYAYALESVGKYKAMEEQIRQILARQPKNAPALNLWAYSLAERETRLNEALQYVTQALEVSPQDVSFRDTLGWIYIKQGRLSEAEDVFSTMPEDVVNQNPEIAYHIGVLRLQQGHLDQALSYLRRAQEGWPSAKKLYKKLSR